MIVGHKLRKLRKEYKITQEMLSYFCGVSRNSISAIERGKNKPTLKVAFNIARFFNLSIEDVFIQNSKKNNNIKKEIQKCLDLLNCHGINSRKQV